MPDRLQIVGNRSPAELARPCSKTAHRPSTMACSLCLFPRPSFGCAFCLLSYPISTRIKSQSFASHKQRVETRELLSRLLRSLSALGPNSVQCRQIQFRNSLDCCTHATCSLRVPYTARYVLPHCMSAYFCLPHPIPIPCLPG